MIGDVTFYPNYIWYNGYNIAVEPSVVGNNYLSSGGETTGPAYDLVDANRNTRLIIDTEGESGICRIDMDVTYFIAIPDFTILDGISVDAVANMKPTYSTGTELTYTPYRGTIGSEMSAATKTGTWINGNLIGQYDDLILALFTAVSHVGWEWYFEEYGATYQDDVWASQMFVGKKFTPATAPDINILPTINYHGVRLQTTLGGQKHSHKRYGERKAWKLGWSYLSEADFVSFKKVYEVTEGERYPFYIDLGESTNPHLYFVRFMEDSMKFKKLSAGAYELSIQIESEV